MINLHFFGAKRCKSLDFSLIFPHKLSKSPEFPPENLPSLPSLRCSARKFDPQKVAEEAQPRFGWWRSSPIPVERRGWNRVLAAVASCDDRISVVFLRPRLRWSWLGKVWYLKMAIIFFEQEYQPPSVRPLEDGNLLPAEACVSRLLLLQWLPRSHVTGGKGENLVQRHFSVSWSIFSMLQITEMQWRFPITSNRKTHLWAHS